MNDGFLKLLYGGLATLLIGSIAVYLSALATPWVTETIPMSKYNQEVTKRDQQINKLEQALEPYESLTLSQLVRPVSRCKVPTPRKETEETIFAIGGSRTEFEYIRMHRFSTSDGEVVGEFVCTDIPGEENLLVINPRTKEEFFDLDTTN